MSIYRYSRELPNGWNVRLDLVPYNENLSGTVVEQPPYGVINIGEQASEFDELPFGLQKPQTLKIELDWEGLKAEVRSIISTGRQATILGEYRNTWMLFSDRGTAGATYTLEFCGVEDNVDALELEPGDNGYVYNAELVDVAYFTMKTLRGSAIFLGYEPEDTKAYRRVYDSRAVSVPSGVESDDQLNRTDGVFDAGAYVSSFEHVMLRFRTICGNYMNALNARITNAFTNPIDGTFDIGSDLPKMIETAVEMYEQNTTYPRSAGSALTKSTAHIITHISDLYKEGTIYDRLYGGMASRADKLAFGRDDVTAWDILKRLAETLGVKLSYSFAYDNTTYTSPARPFVTVKWNVRRIASPITTSNTFDYQDYTVDLNTALTRPSISIRGNNVLKGEARIEVFQDEDISEWALISKGTEASRSINVEPIINNYPTYKTYEGGGTTWLRSTILQTNNIVTKDPNTPDSLLKAHEDTKIYYGPSSTHAISVSTPASAELPPVTNLGLYKLTLAERQVRSCLPYALVKFYSTVFAEEDSASIELEYDLRGSVAYLPQSLGARLLFQNGAAYTFTSLPWSRAITTSIVTNWTEGKTKARYYLMENP
jgi:hypothetical protein